MKQNIILSLIFMVLAVNSVTGQEEDRQFYKDNIATYKSVQNMGLAISGIGGGSVLAGSILMISIPKSYWDTNSNLNTPQNQEAYDRQLIQGMVFFSLGIGLVAGGLTMSNIAKKKATSYRKKLDNLSLGVVSVPGGTGILTDLPLLEQSSAVLRFSLQFAGSFAVLQSCSLAVLQSCSLAVVQSCSRAVCQIT